MLCKVQCKGITIGNKYNETRDCKVQAEICFGLYYIYYIYFFTNVEGIKWWRDKIQVSRYINFCICKKAKSI